MKIKTRYELEDEIGKSINMLRIISFDEGYANGNESGINEMKRKVEEAYKQGHDDGNYHGHITGHPEGYEKGLKAGKREGDAEAYERGYTAGFTSGYSDGDFHGQEVGYDEGYHVGHKVGQNEARTTKLSEGMDALNHALVNTKWDFPAIEEAPVFEYAKQDAEFTHKIGQDTVGHDQMLRELAIQNAKDDIKGLYEYSSGKRCYVVKDIYETQPVYIIDKRKKVVVALLKGVDSGRVRARGIAKTHPNDCFNAHIGKAIALRRALGKEVPNEYLNAPQPTEAKVGDVVRGNGTGNEYTLERRCPKNDGREGKAFTHYKGPFWIGTKQVTIIDDTREGYCDE